MASRLTWLSKLKGSDLKSLAIATGVNSSGTKAEIIKSISKPFDTGASRYDNFSSLEKYAPISGSNCARNIISIDMGIRNLAFCRFSVPKGLHGTSSSRPEKPIVSQWARVDVSSLNLSQSGPISAISKIPSKFEGIPDGTMNAEEAKETKAEPFDLAIYATRAYYLLQNLLLQPDKAQFPSLVLIEHQRHRSMGGRAVLEWTLRVNMFEAMLYAALETLRQEGRWQGQIIPMSPKRIMDYWVRNRQQDTDQTVDDSVTNSKGKKQRGLMKPQQVKRLKIDLVKEWLMTEDRAFTLAGQARAVAQQYLDKLSKQSRRNSLGKVDDLADCLLQGLTFLEWENNRSRVWKDGQMALPNL